MAADSPKAAVDEFLRPLRRALSCITDEYLAGGYDPARSPKLVFPSAQENGYIRLRGDHPIEFRLIHGYNITQDEDGWAVHTTSYSYDFQLDNGREVVVYHFDPRPRSKVKTPHLQARGLIDPLPLSKAHFPTGRVSIEEVIRFAITDLGVRPRHENGIWQTHLAETEKEFFAKKRW